MSYVRFVPGFSRHPKRLKCGPVSSWLWACSVDYCMEHLTDGFLMAEAVPTLCSTITGSALKRAVDNLVAVGSWQPVDGGYQVHDYLRHNQSKSQVEADREAGRKRYQHYVDKQRVNAVDNATTNAVANTEKTARRTDSRSIGLSDVTSTTSKGPVAVATGSNGKAPTPQPTEDEVAEHNAKQERARQLLRSVGWTPPPEMPA